MATDPICGMEVNPKTAKFKAIKNGKEYYFCNVGCRRQFLTGKSSEYTFIQRSIPYILAGAIIIFSVLSFINDFMPKFMGWFFVAVALLKMADWKGFVESFSMYDIIAKKSRLYALAYPAIEFFLGILFLSSYIVNYAAILTFIIMSIGTIGVAKNLMSKNPVKCACLGTLLNIPLTKLTLAEDVVMAIMGLMVFIM